MSFILRFTPAGMSAAKYDECISKLKAAGAGAPKGRSYHVAYGSSSAMHVTDVWDNMDDFAAFGETLIPILQSLGVDPGQPEVMEVHNIIVG
jgi:hypothetical protein